MFRLIQPFGIGSRGGGAAAAPAELGLKTNLVAAWELDEASGNAIDSHTNGLDLTDTNTVTSAAGVGGGWNVPSVYIGEHRIFRPRQ